MATPRTCLLPVQRLRHGKLRTPSGPALQLQRRLWSRQKDGTQTVKQHARPKSNPLEEPNTVWAPWWRISFGVVFIGSVIYSMVQGEQTLSAMTMTFTDSPIV